MNSPIIIFAPFPPSTNTLYPASGGRRHLSKKAAKYKTDVQWQLKRRYSLLQLVTKENHLFCILDLYPPDKRRRDVDNYSKLLIDSFTGLVFEDDSQIKKLLISWREVEAPGSVIITFGKLEQFDDYLRIAKSTEEVPF